MAEMEFVDELPAVARRRGSWSVTVERSDELKAHPGQWAMWPTAMGSSGVRKALARHGEHWQVTSRKVDGKSRAYVRWNPPTEGVAPITALPTPRAPDPARAEAPSAGAVPRTRAGCGHMVPIAEGQEKQDALMAHFDERPDCEAIARRKR